MAIRATRPGDDRPAQDLRTGRSLVAPGELPDYPPVVPEFASTQTPQIARAFLGEMAHLLNAIFNALQQRKSLRQRARRAARTGWANRRAPSGRARRARSTRPGRTGRRSAAARRAGKAGGAADSPASGAMRPA